jgi:hypothetical protein
VSWQDSQKSLCSVVIVYRTDADGNRPRYVFELKSPGVFDRIAKEIRILDGIEENAIDRMVCNSVRTRLSQYLGTELGPDVQYRILIEMGCTLNNSHFSRPFKHFDAKGLRKVSPSPLTVGLG